MYSRENESLSALSEAARLGRESTRSASSRRSGRGRGLGITVVAALILAGIAFLLVPTGQLSSRSLVGVNGLVYSVAAGLTPDDLLRFAAVKVRPGSTLDLTGDVTGFGEGEPAARDLDGTPIIGNELLGDGSVISVRNGQYRLERIKRTGQTIPYETVYEGSGPIVSLSQAGSVGEKEIYKGVASSKQAAIFTVTPPVNAVVRRSSTSRPGQKLVALTFDDGPGEFTQAVLDALAAKHVPATFFMLGASAAAKKSLVAKVRAAGHEVENHSWSHPTLTELTPDEIKSEISRTNAVIGGAHFLRPPYGTYDSVVSAQAKALGMRIVLWTVDTLDWKYPSVDSIMSYVRTETTPGAIILMHDGGKNRSQTVAAIPVLVDWLLARGYSLTTVDHLL